LPSDGPAGERFFDGTKSWLAVGGPLDAVGVGRVWSGCRIVAAEDCAPPDEPDPDEPEVAAPGRGWVGVRTVGAAPVGESETDAAGADADACSPSAAAVVTVGRSDSSVPLAAAAALDEPVLVPPRDTWSG
jgi:hypothetical protein